MNRISIKFISVFAALTLCFSSLILVCPPSVSAAINKGNKAISELTLQYEAGRPGDDQNTNQGGNQNTNQGGNQNTNQGGNQNNNQGSNQNQGGNQNGNQNVNQGGNQNGSQNANQNGNQGNGQNGEQGGNNENGAIGFPGNGDNTPDGFASTGDGSGNGEDEKYTGIAPNRKKDATFSLTGDNMTYGFALLIALCAISSALLATSYKVNKDSQKRTSSTHITINPNLLSH